MDGEEIQEKTAPETRSAADVFFLGSEKEAPEGTSTFKPGQLLRFATGEITLAELQGISKDEQYEIAKMGYSMFETGKLDEALAVFEALATLDPYDAYFQLLLGSIHDRDNKTEAALAHYERSLQLNPKLASAYANRGELLLKQGKLVEAVDDLEKALQCDPKEKEPATQRAKATLQLLHTQLSEQGVKDPD